MKPSTTIVLVVIAAAIGAAGYRQWGPAPAAPHPHSAGKAESAASDHVEQDEHRAERILISDVKLAAAGAVFAEAGTATISRTASAADAARSSGRNRAKASWVTISVFFFICIM